VGFGGAFEDVVRSSLSLLAPHLIIAAVPSRFVFLSQKKTTDKRRTENLCCLSKIQFPFPLSPLLSVSHLPGETFLSRPVLLLLPRFTSPHRPRLSLTPLFWKLLEVSDFACVCFFVAHKTVPVTFKPKYHLATPCSPGSLFLVGVLGCVSRLLACQEGRSV